MHSTSCVADHSLKGHSPRAWSVGNQLWKWGYVALRRVGHPLGAPAELGRTWGRFPELWLQPPVHMHHGVWTSFHTNNKSTDREQQKLICVLDTVSASFTSTSSCVPADFELLVEVLSVPGPLSLPGVQRPKTVLHSSE